MFLYLHAEHKVFLYAIEKFFYEGITDCKQKLIICHEFSEDNLLSKYIAKKFSLLEKCRENRKALFAKIHR